MIAATPCDQALQQSPDCLALLLRPVASVFQTKVEDLSALDVLSGDFVAATKASGVQAPAPPSAKKTPEVNLLCVCVCVYIYIPVIHFVHLLVSDPALLVFVLTCPTVP